MLHNRGQLINICVHCHQSTEIIERAIIGLPPLGADTENLDTKIRVQICHGRCQLQLPTQEDKTNVNGDWEGCKNT